MKLHNDKQIAAAGKALAEMVQRFREMMPSGECGPDVEHTLSLMDQQSAMILREYEVEEDSLGDS